MAKQAIAFKKKIPFDEYILVLKCFMSRYKVQHVSGLCDSELLRRELSETALKELTDRALKHYLFVRQKDAIHIQHEMRIFLSLAAGSKHVVTIHKPSYSRNKLITFFYHGGQYGATVQDVAKNSILLLADPDLNQLYGQLAAEIHAKDINKGFDLKKLRKLSEQKGLDNVFTVKHEYQLVVYPAENLTGKRVAPALMFNVGKHEYEQLAGDLEHGILNKYSAGAVDDHLKDYIAKICKNETGDQRGESESTVHVQTDAEAYTRYSFQKLISSEAFPRSFGQLLKAFGRGLIQNIKSFKLDKRLVFKAIFCLLSFAFVVFWNMYGMCYLNDTFRLNYNAFLGSSTAYLFGGTVSSGEGIYGISVIKGIKDTTLLVQPLYFLLNLLFMCAVNTIISGRLKDFFRGIFGFRGKWKLYRKSLDRPISHYFWTSVLMAAPVGLLLFNPYTVVALAVIVLLSAMKGDDSCLAVFSMIWRSALNCKKVSEGKKKAPTFASGVVRIWTFGLALIVYSGVNLLVWHLFKFNYWSRLIFTVLLMVLALFRLGIIKVSKLGKVQKAAVLIGFILVGTMLAAAASGTVTALADDGGWTESGKTLAGLFNNSGFGIILGFSLVIGAAAFCGAAFLFGATAGTAALIAGAAGSGAMLWSATTETGKETAYDFVLGKYSPYGGDSLIATGLDIAIGFVPFVGNAWQTISCTRDATYDFSNGNYLMGTVEAVFAGLGAKGLYDEIGTVIKKVPSNIATDDQMFSTYEERINRTPDKNGHWTGDRGESTFISDKTDKVGKYLDDAGVDGITYKNGQADFSPVSKGNVQIDNMSTKRLGKNSNFEQADEALAAIRGNGCTADDVAKWRQANGYTWHECNDMTTMQKVPSAINSTFSHMGGVGELRRAEEAKTATRIVYDEALGLFDE